MSEELIVVEDLDNATDFQLKHFPTLTLDGKKAKVEVGKKVPHPQTEEHLIDRIDIFVDGKLYKSFKLTANDPAVVSLEIDGKPGAKVYATSDCNLHGNWKSEELTLA